MRFAGIWVVAAMALGGCAAPDVERARAPGYAGTCPSPAAQERLNASAGRPIPVGVAGVAEEGWVLGDFGVVPSDAAPGGLGPVVVLRKGSASRHLHVPDDAAVDRLLAGIGKGSEPR